MMIVYYLGYLRERRGGKTHEEIKEDVNETLTYFRERYERDLKRDIGA